MIWRIATQEISSNYFVFFFNDQRYTSRLLHLSTIFFMKGGWKCYARESVWNKITFFKTTVLLFSLTCRSSAKQVAFAILHRCLNTRHSQWDRVIKNSYYQSFTEWIIDLKIQFFWLIPFFCVYQLIYLKYQWQYFSMTVMTDINACQ